MFFFVNISNGFQVKSVRKMDRQDILIGKSLSGGREALYLPTDTLVGVKLTISPLCRKVDQ